MNIIYFQKHKFIYNILFEKSLLNIFDVIYFIIMSYNKNIIKYY